MNSGGDPRSPHGFNFRTYADIRTDSFRNNDWTMFIRKDFGAHAIRYGGLRIAHEMAHIVLEADVAPPQEDER